MSNEGPPEIITGTGNPDPQQITGKFLLQLRRDPAPHFLVSGPGINGYLYLPISIETAQALALGLLALPGCGGEPSDKFLETYLEEKLALYQAKKKFAQLIDDEVSH